MIAKDPAVSNATGYIGPGGHVGSRENNGRLFILLKLTRSARALHRLIRSSGGSISSLQKLQAFRSSCRPRRKYSNLASRLSKTQYQYTLTDVNQDELGIDGHRDFMRNCVACGTRRCRNRPGQCRPSTQTADRSRRRIASGIDHATVDNTLYDAFGVPAPRRAAVHHAQQQLCHPGSGSVIPARPLSPLNRIYGCAHLQQEPWCRWGRSPRLRRGLRHWRSIMSEPTSVGDAELQPRARRRRGDRRSRLIQNATAALHMQGYRDGGVSGNAQAFSSPSLKSTPVLIVGGPSSRSI